MLDFAKLLLVLMRPGSLILTILMYLLGTGIADFLGAPMDSAANWLGLACSILLIVSSQFLDLFFRAYEPNLARPIQDAIAQKKPDLSLTDFRRLMIQAGVTTLTISAVTTMLLITRGRINPAALTILGTSFILAFFYAVPPVTLSRKGLGEVIETILITNLTPAFAFLLQTGEMHRLLFMLTPPLTALTLAMRLAMALPEYGRDVATEKLNMMTSIGWEHGMRFHNYLIVLAYAILLIAFAFGLPWRLVWPGLLTLPIGAYQIIQIHQIASGIKPNWNVLTLTSIALVGLTAYLITLSVWIG